MASTTRFVALVIYPSASAGQVGEADTLLREAESTIRAMPGFVSGRVFLAEDGESVVTMVEWRDRESFVNFRQSELGRAGVELAGERHPKAYWLIPHALVTPG
jgi:heme-degrading monooxygenase HmoA